MAKKLKVLDLSRTPDFSTFTALEILNLGMCKNLVKIHPSIYGLSRLQTLDLSQCHELQSLPELPPSLMSLHVTCRLMETVFPT
jgi:hypothetical protein